MSHPQPTDKNPNVLARAEDLSAAFNLQLRISDDITKTSEATNKLEWMRKQLDVIARMLGGRKSVPQGATEKKEETNDATKGAKQEKSEANPDPELLKAVEAMAQKMQDVEYRFISRAHASSHGNYCSI